ncbi:hypothetical protein TGMAS_414000 [Toxoplasma gondii MAS]|uniref:Uncharacterized protein n=1 Tax=Toxoplasma gondii MAS TaxID=943118 RepID=A0A086QRL4_TOXGO|nr:hypothetical protein TGMAS_414000 [Toxoplasma gondii MAS]
MQICDLGNTRTTRRTMETKHELYGRGTAETKGRRNEKQRTLALAKRHRQQRHPQRPRFSSGSRKRQMLAQNLVRALPELTSERPLFGLLCVFLCFSEKAKKRNSLTAHARRCARQQARSTRNVESREKNAQTVGGEVKKSWKEREKGRANREKQERMRKAVSLMPAKGRKNRVFRSSSTAPFC